MSFHILLLPTFSLGVGNVNRGVGLPKSRSVNSGG